MLSTARAFGLNLLVPAKDTGVGLSLREAGEFGRAEVDLINDCCDGDLLDVGANIGAICLPFAATHSQARIVAIEAHRRISQILAANALNNGLYNVDVHNVVAGERAATIDVPQIPLDVERNIGASSLFEADWPTERLRMAPLDEVAPSNTRFVKIDVEGFEPRVLEGARHLLSAVRPFWLVEVSRQRPKTTERVAKILSDAGYRLYWFFSPFDTRDIARGKVRGDFAYFACDGDPPSEMRAVSENWPNRISELPNLRRYLNSPQQIL